MDIEIQKLKFLIKINSLLDGICVSDEADISFIQFNLTLKSAHIKSGLWSPNKACFEIIERCVFEYFGVDKVHYNNTGTIFWFKELGR